MRRLLVGVAAALVAAVVVLAAAPAVLQWWSVRSSSAPDVAVAALRCQGGGGRVVTSVQARPWGWVVRVQKWRVAYLGADDNASGAPATYVTRDGDVLVPWSSGSSPPTDPVTGQPLTAPGADDPWQADVALAVAQHRAPYVAERCLTRQI